MKNGILNVSKMSGKLEGFESINTNPLDNSYCMDNTNEICRKCYSKKMLKSFRKSCVPSFSENSRYLSESIIPFEYLPKFPNRQFIRFHSHGELINNIHYENFCNIAWENPRVTFSLWTKRKDLVGKAPENMIQIYSNYDIDNFPPESEYYIDEFLPRYFDFSFNVVTKLPENREFQVCSGKCIDCLYCYRKGNVFPVAELLKE